MTDQEFLDEAQSVLDLNMGVDSFIDEMEQLIEKWKSEQE